MVKLFLLWFVVAPALCWGQQASDWISYRDAYREMIWFEKYGKPKQFLQNHLRLRPRDGGAQMEGLRLMLNSKTARLDVPLDALGRAVFPFSKAAYDDNAELELNRNPGQFSHGAWVSIITRADGVYAVADLLTACEQIVAYLRYTGAPRGKSCAGVQFAYAKGEVAQVRVARNGGSVALAAVDGPAFPGDAVTGFRVFVYRFAAFGDGVQVVTSSTPLAIAALLE
ncbi:hypothetical protein [Janthinobacterium sp. LB3P118]|uniref:hypothetical protein n=1 Tax=Janthinobacterium sp. LB3P118 TaxID=3424195 RepID=UPI003F22B148